MTAREVCRNARHSTAVRRLRIGCAAALGTVRHSGPALDAFPLLTSGFRAVPAASAHPGTARRAVTAAWVCRRCRSLRTGTRHTPHTRPRPATTANRPTTTERRACAAGGDDR